MSEVWVLRAPSLNANDGEVLLTRWLVESGSRVSQNQTVAEIETSKATAEVTVEQAGLLEIIVQVGATVAVGAPLAYVGADAAAIDVWKTSQKVAKANVGTAISATAKAKALAERHGIDLALVAAETSAESVKEADVQRYLDRHRPAALAPVGRQHYHVVGSLSPHQPAVADNLRTSLSHGIFTTLDFTLELDAPLAILSNRLVEGKYVSLLNLVLLSIAQVLPKFPLLTTVVDGTRLLRYGAMDIAFVARSLDGRLFTPVVRGVDGLDLDGIARECMRLSKQAMRGRLAAEDIDGAAFTVSLIPNAGVSAFVALPATGQSAILSIGAERHELSLVRGEVTERRVTTAVLTYDHALADGIYAAEFLTELNQALAGGGL